MAFTPSSFLASLGQPLDTTASTPGIRSTHLASTPQVCMYMCEPYGWSGSLPMKRILVFGLSAALARPAKSRNMPVAMQVLRKVVINGFLPWVVHQVGPDFRE